jgi:hypothetical protein
VWPTLKLTEEEVSLFKRNSRVFVTDLGRPIQLTTKFEMAKATQVVFLGGQFDLFVTNTRVRKKKVERSRWAQTAPDAVASNT